VTDSIKIFADECEARRKEHSDALEKRGALVFQPYALSELEGHGVGWFEIGDAIYAYKRLSNGYEMYPSQSIPTDVLKLIAKKLEES
jgi:hypothetical protein